VLLEEIVVVELMRLDNPSGTLACLRYEVTVPSTKMDCGAPAPKWLLTIASQTRRDTFTITNAATRSKNASFSDTVRILLVVEGSNDIEFLRRVSLMLHADNASRPNLAAMENQGELIFVPCGGGDMQAWTHRFAPLAKPEFHLIDHEVPPETEYRQQAIELINRRAKCRAMLTRKRSLENYLHPLAIRSAGEFEIEFGDFDQVAELTAQAIYRRSLDERPWALLPRRARRRFINRAKRWLNTRAVAEMTMPMLSESDPQGEIVSWFRMIRELANFV
jgi:hypothetical protein